MKAKEKNIKYPGIYLAENIVDYPGQIGIICLSYPRCFVWFDMDEDSLYCSFEEFLTGIAHINWLDPQDSRTKKEEKNTLIKMWNFLCEQEAEEEKLCEGYNENDEDDF